MKIICKENLIDDGKIIFKKNENYYIVTDKYSHIEKYIIFDEYQNSCLYLVDDYERDLVLEIYFYTEKECRKLKLIKLNEKMSI